MVSAWQFTRVNSREYRVEQQPVMNCVQKSNQPISQSITLTDTGSDSSKFEHTHRYQV